MARTVCDCQVRLPWCAPHISLRRARPHTVPGLPAHGCKLLEQHGVVGGEAPLERGDELGVITPCASRARAHGSRSPRTRARSMARPDAPRASLTTGASLMFADSRSLCTRVASATRCRMTVCDRERVAKAIDPSVFNTRILCFR